MNALFLTLCISTLAVVPDAQLDQIFRTWKEANRNVQSLLIEFELERRELGAKTPEVFSGSLSAQRLKDGQVFVRYEVVSKGKKANSPPCILFRNGNVYMLCSAVKTAYGQALPSGGLGKYMEHINPFVALLDERQAEDRFLIRIEKRDEWYTYIAIRHRNPQKSGWSPDELVTGRIVLLRRRFKITPQYQPWGLMFRISSSVA